jgi:hypothetical protein
MASLDVLWEPRSFPMKQTEVYARPSDGPVDLRVDDGSRRITIALQDGKSALQLALDTNAHLIAVTLRDGGATMNGTDATRLADQLVRTSYRGRVAVAHSVVIAQRSV